jgi:hypothetical protein
VLHLPCSQVRKNHRNGIKKPANNRYSSTKGVSALSDLSSPAIAPCFPPDMTPPLHAPCSLLSQMDPKFVRNQVSRAHGGRRMQSSHDWGSDWTLCGRESLRSDRMHAPPAHTAPPQRHAKKHNNKALEK